ncbi:MAG TPA: ABC transporter permease [Cyclobacteriaceae bacterium]
MIKNYIKTIIRQLISNKTYSLVNILGLSMGMAACLIIIQYVFHHTSFDKYHKNTDAIYRIKAKVYQDGEVLHETINLSPLLPEFLHNELPLVKNYTQFWRLSHLNFTLKNISGTEMTAIDEEDVFLSQVNTFEIFDLPVVAGTYKQLNQPNKLVVSETLAKKLFGEAEKAINKTISLEHNMGNNRMEIVGVFKDLPENTHLDFEVLISFPSYKSFYPEVRFSWGNSFSYCYLQLDDKASASEVAASAQGIFDKNMENPVRDYILRLESLREIHFASPKKEDFKKPVNKRIIWAMGIIALIILVIAWINYFNLAMVKTIERLKEVGIRKVLGSSQNNITILFILESFFLNLLSFVLALTLTQAFSPYLKSFTAFRVDIFNNISLILAALSFVIAGALITGFYPAFIVRTVKTSSTILDKEKHKIGGVRLRHILISVQFIITFLLLAGTLTVYKQITFMKNADLGINIDNTLVIKAPPSDVGNNGRAFLETYNTFKNTLTHFVDIENITSAGTIPGETEGWRSNVRLKNQPKEKTIDVTNISMGSGFLDFFDLELLAGVNLQSGDGPWSNGKVMINQKLATLLGFDNLQDAVGKHLVGFGSGGVDELIITGIVENHNHHSLHYDYKPMIYILTSWVEYFFVKLNADDALPYDQQIKQLNLIKEQVEKTWEATYPGYSFDYSFLDKSFDQQYQEDEQFGKLFSTFSGLAIVIACLGLFGLTSFNLQRRTKEIGIRKVLGADLKSLMLLLSKTFMVLIGLSYVIAMPISWVIFSNWLENYHFRIDLGWWLFIIPLFFVAGIAFISILGKILRSVQTNPVNALKDE